MNKYHGITELIVRLIIKKDTDVLLCRNLKHKHYFLPGGHVEFGDSLETTIYKEMEEELGLSSDDISEIVFQDYLEHVYGEGDDKHHELNMIFTATLSDDVVTESQEEHIAFAWIPLENIPETFLLPEEIKKFIA